MCAASVGDVSRTPGTGGSMSAFMLARDDMPALCATVASPISAACEHTTGCMWERSVMCVFYAESRFTMPVHSAATSECIQVNVHFPAHTARNSSPTAAICQDTNDLIVARSHSPVMSVASASQTEIVLSTMRHFMHDIVPIAVIMLKR